MKKDNGSKTTTQTIFLAIEKSDLDAARALLDGDPMLVNARSVAKWNQFFIVVKSCTVYVVRVFRLLNFLLDRGMIAEAMQRGRREEKNKISRRKVYQLPEDVIGDLIHAALVYNQ